MVNSLSRNFFVCSSLWWNSSGYMWQGDPRYNGAGWLSVWKKTQKEEHRLCWGNLTTWVKEIFLMRWILSALTKSFRSRSRKTNRISCWWVSFFWRLMLEKNLFVFGQGNQNCYSISQQMHWFPVFAPKSPGLSVAAGANHRSRSHHASTVHGVLLLENNNRCIRHKWSSLDDQWKKKKQTLKLN